MNKLEEWIASNQLDATVQEDLLCTLNDKDYIWIKPKQAEVTINGAFEIQDNIIIVEGDGDRIEPYLNVDEEEEEIIQELNIPFYVFEFGGKFYFHPVTEGHILKEPELFKYIGKCKSDGGEIPYVHLGVRGEYEILCGSGSYDKWVAKTKFYGYNTLGICEKNTLGGVLAFQLACGKDIKPIIGETITIKVGNLYTEGKVFALNKRGWKNLLYINKIINVDRNGQDIEEAELLKLGEGIAFIFHPETELSIGKINQYKHVFDLLYYQFDSVEYSSDEKDTEHLLATKKYFNEFITLVPPIFISDSFYLDKEYAHIQKALISISGKRINESKNRFYKNADQVLGEMYPLFNDEKTFQGITKDEIFEIAFMNTIELAEQCNFTIETKSLKLPKYTYEYDFGTGEILGGEALFQYLIDQGIETKLRGRVDEDELEAYLDRVAMEYEVISKGNLIDYFLILWDIINYCKENNILTGIGRGSAAGSLITYLLDITRVDPLRFDLLFERFLNESRIKESLPDIDVDFESEKRDDVKRYMEQRFGLSHVCCVGTYTTLKVKAALKDLGRSYGYGHQDLNWFTKTIEDREEWKWFEFMLYANNKNPNTKENIQKYPRLVNDIQLILNQPRSCSIHASAVVIVPEFDLEGNKMEIWDWFPVKKVDGILVSEWEGTYMEKAGFLKEDILGIRQLDKFKFILKLIEDTTGEKVDIYNIPYENKKVFDLFKEGYNEDVFHFGTGGLKAYCKEMKPDRIEDLVAINALHRPGPMNSGAHIDFVKIKFGEKEAEYDFMLEEVTKETNGLYIYQEQIMRAAAILADFNLVEADNLRRAMGKKIKSLMDEYKTIFTTRAKAKGCPEQEALNIWKKLEQFAEYGFNKSHAASYSITGYICQWLKVNYPLQFWTASLHFASEDEIHLRQGEIKKCGQDVFLSEPDINHSAREFRLDVKKKTIYWSIEKISQCGPATVDHILEVRNTGGEFYSLEEFRSRVQKAKVKKNVLLNLILSGCFDKVEGLKTANRLKIVKKYYTMIGEEFNHELFPPEWVNKTYFWIMKQKELTGLGILEYKAMIDRAGSKKKFYVDADEFSQLAGSYQEVLVGGVVKEIKERTTKKKDKFAEISLDHNGEIISCLFWPEQWIKYKKALMDNKDDILFITGVVKFDDRYKKSNVLYAQENTCLFTQEGVVDIKEKV